MILAIAALAGCSGSTSLAEGTPPLSGHITGAGATLPYPIYSKWFADYHRLHPSVSINYQSLGSGAGIRQLVSRTVFFGASDEPMTDAQLRAAPAPIGHFPTVVGAVVPIYNLPGLSSELKFTGPLLADIILGKITRWDDPALARVNRGVALPATAIIVVHRSDGSGTTFILADYLAKVSPEFKTTIGVDASLRWPVGVGAKGNEGVTGLVQQTPGAFGYVELLYALQTTIPYGAVENAAGRFIRATVDSVAAAAASALPDMPADFRVSISNIGGADVYPISSYTWILLYRHSPDRISTRIMADFLRWAITDGQASARALGYAPLPQLVIDRELQALEQLGAK